MITFTTMNITGFCSIDNLHLQLNPNCTVLVRASNGKGKSSMLSALVWAIYGKNLKGVSEVTTWEKLRPKDYRGVMVEVYFQKNEHTYKIIRCQKCDIILEDGFKGRDRLIFLKDGELINIKGKLKIQEAIENELGLSYTLFMNSVMFGQGIKRLIQESNSDKKKIFEEVFDLEFLNIAKGVAMQDRSNIISSINEVEHQSELLKKELIANKEAYFDLREREKTFKEDIKKERRELKKEREKLTMLLREKQKNLNDEVESTLNMKLKKQDKLISSLKLELKEAKNVSDGVSLPEFVKKLKIQLDKGRYKQASKSVSIIYNSLIKSDKLRKELDEALDRLDNLRETDSKYKKLQDECSDIASDMASIDEELDKLKREKLKVMSPKYKERLRSIRKDLRKVDEDFHNKELELENYNWLINDPLGNNGIKAYLFDSSLGMLNKTLEKYSEVLGFRIEFNIDLSSTRKDFVTLIERDSQTIDYDELSGGERQLVNVAMAFAMNESLTLSKGLNLAFLDEVFESLSADNIEIVTQLIKHTFSNKTLFLITHLDSLPLSNVKIMQVEKVNGLSQYKLL